MRPRVVFNHRSRCVTSATGRRRLPPNGSSADGYPMGISAAVCTFAGMPSMVLISSSNIEWDGRQRRAESKRACRQQEVLHGGVYRRSGQELTRPGGLLRRVFVAHKNQDRGISHVEGQMRYRFVDLLRQSGDRLLADTGLLARTSVVVPDLLLRLDISYDDKTPWLRVPPTWSANRRLEDALNERVRHRRAREPADRTLTYVWRRTAKFPCVSIAATRIPRPRTPNDVQSERSTRVVNNGENMTVRVSGTVLDERGEMESLELLYRTGRTLVRTDGRGRYDIDAERGSHSFITVSVPDTYRVAGAFYRRRSNDRHDG